MEAPNSDLDHVDILRQTLESNVAKLRKTLNYWQTWDAEHEGLKEELQNLPKNASTKAMMDAGLGLEGEVVNEREVKELTGFDKGIPRNRAQVISSVDGRIETGRKNAQTVQKQLEVAEGQLEYLVEATQPKSEEADGLPVMDIYEELDDDGNIISSQVTNTQDTTAQLDAISKRYTPSTLADSSSDKPPQASTVSATAPPSADPPSPLLERASSDTPTRTADEPHATLAPGHDKKKVTFASEPEVSTFTSLPSHIENASTTLSSGLGSKELLLHPTKRILELDEDDNVVGSRPLELVVPLSEDETLLHHQEAMRNMSDIGAVVAEMNLDSDMEDEDDDYDDDESLDENDVGMTNIGAHITDEYKADMEALMKKHEAAFKNLEDQPILKPLKPTLGVGNGTTNGANSSASAEPKTKKGVNFADDLDISPAPPAVLPAAATAAIPSTSKANIAQTPFSDSVIERVGSVVESANIPTAPPKKLSKFKAARLGKDQS